MKITFRIVLSIAILALVIKCKDEDPYYEKDFHYYGGDGKVHYYQAANIDYDINGNLVVDGDVTLTDSLKIASDLNINTKGKVIIETQTQTTEVVVFGNVNINDSLFLNKGNLRIIGDFNINVGGFLTVSDSARIIIEKDLNQNDWIYGFRNIYVLHETHLNNETRVYYEPYYTAYFPPTYPTHGSSDNSDTYFN